MAHWSGKEQFRPSIKHDRRPQVEKPTFEIVGDVEAAAAKVAAARVKYAALGDGDKETVAVASLTLKAMAAGEEWARALWLHDTTRPETWWAYEAARELMAPREPASASSFRMADGAGPGDSAPDAEDLLDYRREGSTEDEDRLDIMAEYRPIGG